MRLRRRRTPNGCSGSSVFGYVSMFPDIDADVARCYRLLCTVRSDVTHADGDCITGTHPRKILEHTATCQPRTGHAKRHGVAVCQPTEKEVRCGTHARFEGRKTWIERR